MLVDQVYAHSQQSGMASVAERVTARALRGQAKQQVIERNFTVLNGLGRPPCSKPGQRCRLGPFPEYGADCLTSSFLMHQDSSRLAMRFPHARPS
jgi:hypothetical protein